MREYIDRSLFTNPGGEYLKWLKCKATLQLKNWGKHLRIGYLSQVNSCTFGKYNWIGTNCVVTNVQMGDFSYINSFSYILNTTMGSFCSIGPNVKIAPGKHPTSVFVCTHPVTYNNQSNFVKNFVRESRFQNFQPVTMGHDVWVGANAIIIDGVTIADGAIIAANSLVTKDVGPYEIVGGNPAKFIRKRFDDGQIKYLQSFKWWENDYAWIQQNILRFENIEDFVEYSY